MSRRGSCSYPACSRLPDTSCSPSPRWKNQSRKRTVPTRSRWRITGSQRYYLDARRIRETPSPLQRLRRSARHLPEMVAEPGVDGSASAGRGSHAGFATSSPTAPPRPISPAGISASMARSSATRSTMDLATVPSGLRPHLRQRPVAAVQIKHSSPVARPYSCTCFNHALVAIYRAGASMSAGQRRGDDGWRRTRPKAGVRLLGRHLHPDRSGWNSPPTIVCG